MFVCLSKHTNGWISNNDVLSACKRVRERETAEKVREREKKRVRIDIYVPVLHTFRVASWDLCTLTDCRVNCLLSAQLLNCWITRTRRDSTVIQEGHQHRHHGLAAMWQPLKKYLSRRTRYLVLVCRSRVSAWHFLVCERQRKSKLFLKNKMSDEHRGWYRVYCFHFSPHQVEGRTLQSWNHELQLHGEES